MKRFLSLLALAVVPAAAWAVDAPMQQQGMASTMGGMMDKAKCCLFGGPVSAGNDTWAARTDVSVDWGKFSKKMRAHNRSYELYSVNTIQPIHLNDDMHNTVFGYAGIGTRDWDHSAWTIGVGARHMTACSRHMFGIGVGYQDFKVRHVDFRGPEAIAEWMTPYTTLTYKYAWDELKVTHHARNGYLHHRHDAKLQNLDLSFQLPYLPWTQFMVGKTWYSDKVGHKVFHTHHNTSFRHLDYGLRMNLLGCLALEGGRVGGYKDAHYVRLIVSFGRSADSEYVLSDGIIAPEILTARDLRNHSLAPLARTRAE